MMNGTDRLSPLSDSVLHHIFSFLNIKSLIQTCVLSKRWKTLWIDTPTLNFDFDSYPFKISTRNGPCSKYSSIKRFIFRVFSDHRCQSIQKLSYSSSIHTYEAGLVVDLLICYARHRQVQELCINTFESIYLDCPLDLLEFSSLTELRITCCFVDEWDELIFSRLRILEVRYAWINWDYAANYKDFGVFWDCPCLESLVVVHCVFGSVCIHAPKLENFEFSLSSEWELCFPQFELRMPKLKNVKLCHVLPIIESDSEFSCMHDVIIKLGNSEFDGDDSATRKWTEELSQLLKVFHNARSFILPLKAMEVLCSIPPSLNRLSFHNLRHLKLKTKATNYTISLPVGTLMRSLKCPNLEMLEVDLNQRVSQRQQQIALVLQENELLEERERLFQEDKLRQQKREEDRAKMDKLREMISLLFNQQERSQVGSEGGPST